MSQYPFVRHPSLGRDMQLGEGDVTGVLYYNAATRFVELADSAKLNELIYSDTYWDDLQVSLTSGKQGANEKPDFDETNVGYLFPQNNTDEILYLITQMPHKWKVGTTIFPHVHWRQAANQTPVFKIDYKVYPVGGAVPGSFTTYTMSTKVATYTSGTIGQVSDNATGISMAGLGISTMFVCRLYRDDNAYTGDVLTDQFDIHYEIDAGGSDDPFVK